MSVPVKFSLQMFILFNCLFLLTRKQSTRNLLHQGWEKLGLTNDKENDNRIINHTIFIPVFEKISWNWRTKWYIYIMRESIV